MSDPQTAPLLCQLGLHKWREMPPYPLDHPYSMQTRLLTTYFYKRQRCERCEEARLKKRHRW